MLDTNKEYVISWSGGKDSTATILLAIENNIKIKEIVTYDIMYDDTHSAVPFIDDFKAECIRYFESLGIKCTRLTCKYTFKEMFTRKRIRGANVGKMYGMPLSGMCIFTHYKQADIKKYVGDNPQIIGIAIDEPKRLERIKEPNVSLLAEYGYTEQMAKDLCIKHNMLSPLYKMGNLRDGCFFCPNAYKTSLVNLYKEYPDMYMDFKNFVLDNIQYAVCDKYLYKKSVYDVFNYVEKGVTK